MEPSSAATAGNVRSPERGAPRWLRPAAAGWAVALTVAFVAAVLDLFVFHHFKDDPSLCVATATGVLAAVTVLVVADTRDESAATQDQLRQFTKQAQAAQDQVAAVKAATNLSNRAFQASYRPLVADIPYDRSAELETLRPGRDLVFNEINTTEVFVSNSAVGVAVSVPLRNAGTGIAILTGGGIETFPDSNGASARGGICALTASTVNPGERFRITCFVPADRDDWANLRDLVVSGWPSLMSVAYMDQAGDSWMTDAHLIRSGSKWYVRQISFMRFPSKELIFTSGPADVHGIPDHIR